MRRAFLDSNILVYALDDDLKAVVARTLYQAGGRASIQWLNELANVARNKLKLDWDKVIEAIDDVRTRCAPVVPVNETLHRDGLRLPQRYRLSVYDGMMVAAALAAECDVLYSEDMRHGLIVDGRLEIVNPFRDLPA